MFLNIVYAVVVYGVVLLIEVHKLIPKKQWGEMGLALSLTAMGFILTLLQILDVAVLSPITIITCVVEDILGIRGI